MVFCHWNTAFVFVELWEYLVFMLYYGNLH